jgi:hypothetical protein
LAGPALVPTTKRRTGRTYQEDGPAGPSIHRWRLRRLLYGCGRRGLLRLTIWWPGSRRGSATVRTGGLTASVARMSFTGLSVGSRRSDRVTGTGRTSWAGR